jgi:hypothetical protein
MFDLLLKQFDFVGGEIEEAIDAVAEYGLRIVLPQRGSDPKPKVARRATLGIPMSSPTNLNEVVAMADARMAATALRLG